MGPKQHQIRCLRHREFRHLVQIANAAVIAFVLLIAFSPSSFAHPENDFSSTDIQQLVHQQVNAQQDWSAGAIHWEAVRRVYAGNQYQLFWTHDQSHGLDIHTFVSILQSAPQHGLPTDKYHLRSIEQQLSAHLPDERVWLDILLTDAFLKYVTDIGTGYFDPRSSDDAWYIERPVLNASELLFSIYKHNNLQQTISQITPQTRDYKNLLMSLDIYSAIRDQGGWEDLPTGPTLKLGDVHPHVILLRERLLKEGVSFITDTANPRFDLALEHAVRRFQYRHGLDVDGQSGPQTRKAANVPVEYRISQIKLNLERQRWLPRERGALHVVVNLSDFRLDVMQSGQSILSMPIIIGTLDRSTPVFENKISYMVINPEWNIPKRIAREELIPRQIQDEGYFNSLNIKAVSGWDHDAPEVNIQEVDWQQWLQEASPYRLVQRSGENNSLGRIKFMFPNPFSVYMHDTPHHQLFNRRVRTLSHGCIRISRPIEFANTLLEQLSANHSLAIEDQVKSGETKLVRLPKPVPVYLIYKTAWADEDGLIHFRDDIYKRDQRMMNYAAALNAQ